MPGSKAVKERIEDLIAQAPRIGFDCWYPLSATGLANGRTKRRRSGLPIARRPPSIPKRPPDYRRRGPGSWILRPGDGPHDGKVA